MKSSHKKRIDALDASIEELNFASPEMEYAQIFDRGSEEEPLSRYLRHNIKLPTPMWAEFFVSSGGSFDSAGVWGITPEEGVKFEDSGVPGSFVGNILKLTGRADSYAFDFKKIPELFALGVIPYSLNELAAYGRGLERIESAKMAGVQELKSVLRYGWMKENKWEEYLLENSRKIFWAERCHFNGIRFSGQSAQRRAQKVKNPLFQKWYQNRPSKKEMAQRRLSRHEGFHPAREGFIKKIPHHLIAAAMRRGFLESYSHRNKGITENTGVCFEQSNTSVGRIFFGKCIFIHETNEYATARNIQVKNLSNGLCCCRVYSTWFVWDRQEGFKNHIEGDSLKGALKMWQKRSQKGQPRPLCLNDVRNDRVGTAGFCLAGTKAFLEDRMPFVFRMVAEYTSWEQIPEDIMSLEFEVDFKIFEGYRVP